MGEHQVAHAGITSMSPDERLAAAAQILYDAAMRVALEDAQQAADTGEVAA